jgi:DNA helicase-2/ATP-dependent DNA helicase PcrA
VSCFASFLKNELNTPQRKAVKHKNGAVMVIAGAGSGKTRVITARIAYLILEQNIYPRSIVALTFTNKAAKEMKTRLARFLGTEASLPFVGTFHSYCLLLLRTNPDLLPFSPFSILDADDQISLLKKIIKNAGLTKQVTANDIGHQISHEKNKFMTGSAEEIFSRPIFKEIYVIYESEKAAARCLDFDDLLIVMHNTFKENKIFTEKFQKHIRHLLVDEYQDTNMVQHELLKQMALTIRKKKNKFMLDSICVVGDEDQSIYSWRGAVVTNMLTFQKEFAPVTIVKVEQNYRSVQQILEAANHVIIHNSQRHEKKLWSEKKAKNRIMLVSCQSGYDEAEHIASLLQLLIKQQKLHEIAILYRTHFQSRIIEEALIRAAIPYYIVGGIRFYERKEIKDMLAYLRLFANPFDRTSFFRIINRPQRGLGIKFEELVYAQWQENPFFDFKQLLHHLLKKKKSVPKSKADALKTFLSIFEKYKKTDLPSKIIKELLKRTDYLAHLRRTHDAQEADAKHENIRELVQSIEHFEQTVDKKNKESLLERFLHEISLLQEKMDHTTGIHDYVQLMTLHAVKGLEFETVIIAGVEENLLPSSRSLYHPDALEEERRLFYVGMTRAKERLILLHAHYRNSFGQISDQNLSRFAAEIPSKFCYYLDATDITRTKTKTLCADWLGMKQPKGKIITFGAASVKQIPQTIKKTAANKKITSRIPWKKNMPVQHKTFGTGIITKVEKRGPDSYFLTVTFKKGSKHISSRFVKAV